MYDFNGNEKKRKKTHISFCEFELIHCHHDDIHSLAMCYCIIQYQIVIIIMHYNRVLCAVVVAAVFCLLSSISCKPLFVPCVLKIVIKLSLNKRGNRILL